MEFAWDGRWKCNFSKVVTSFLTMNGMSLTKACNFSTNCRQRFLQLPAKHELLKCKTYAIVRTKNCMKSQVDCRNRHTGGCGFESSNFRYRSPILILSLQLLFVQWNVCWALVLQVTGNKVFLITRWLPTRGASYWALSKLSGILNTIRSPNKKSLSSWYVNNYWIQLWRSISGRSYDFVASKNEEKMKYHWLSREGSSA